jgi:hypothetical protein
MLKACKFFPLVKLQLKVVQVLKEATASSNVEFQITAALSSSQPSIEGAVYLKGH